MWESSRLLLTDIIMPEKTTGRDLAEQLWKQSPELKVVFMSGYSADVIGRDADFIRRTKSRFLQKPCSSRTLLETVRQCLDGGGKAEGQRLKAEGAPTKEGLKQVVGASEREEGGREK